MKPIWKKGRGKLGFIEPLLGTWIAEAGTPMGEARCTRTFAKMGGQGKWITLEADWDFGGKHYIEHAVYGIGDDSKPAFWSFTSDGRRSEGRLTDGTDVHDEAIAFEAQMPAGLARMIYWPGEDETVKWAVESKTKKGWNRFTSHTYLRA
ncbi:MAG: hypothetical protein ABI539_04250 [Acidobacteriota bacterium]